jgi:NADH:ubiquinone oxidoreductase subunit D
MGVEQLLGITEQIPTRAKQARVLLCELHRIASHLVWLGTGGIDLGAISGFFYAFDMREKILDLTELSGGARMHPNYLRIGGLRDDLPAGFLDRLDALIEMYPRRMREMRNLLQRTTCAARSRISVTSSTNSTSSRAPRVTPTRASSCDSTRWISRCGSSNRCASNSRRPDP